MYYVVYACVHIGADTYITRVH